jgi:hypothetical protein
MPDDLAILKEQERLISGLNPPQPVIFRSNHASNALALAGNLPRDKEKLLLQLGRRWPGSERCDRISCAGFDAEEHAGGRHFVRLPTA